MPWDSSTAFVLLNRADCVRLLDSYLTERLTAEQCETWAEAIESREDVELEDGASDLLKAFLFEISTPEINGPLSLESAREWKDRLA